MRPEEFDETLKRVLESREFDYDPAAWEKARALLEQRKKRPALWWWPFFVLTALLVTAGGWYLWSQSTASSTASLAENSNRQVAAALPKTETTEKPQPEASEKIYVSDSLTTKTTPSQPVRLITDEKGNTRTATEPVSPPEAATEKEHPSLTRLKRRNTALFGRKEIAHEFLSEPREIADKPFDYNNSPPRQSPDLSLGLTLSAARQKNSPENGNKTQNSIAAGVFGQWYFLPWLGLQLEPSLAYRNGLSINSTVNDTLFGFGQVISSHETTVKDALLLHIPAGLVWRFHPKHSLGGGISYHHYLGSGIQERRISYENNVPVSDQSATSKGRLKSLSYADMGWYATYQFRIQDAFSLGLRYQATPAGTGLLHIPAEPPLRISLHYHLYRLNP